MYEESAFTWELNLHRELSKGIVLERSTCKLKWENIESAEAIDSKGIQKSTSGLYKHTDEQLNGIELIHVHLTMTMCVCE